MIRTGKLKQLTFLTVQLSQTMQVNDRVRNWIEQVLNPAVLCRIHSGIKIPVSIYYMCCSRYEIIQFLTHNSALISFASF